MGAEVTFRKSVFGGFNRSDVLKYINDAAVANKDRQTIEGQLTDAKVQIETLKAQLDEKNKELEALKKASAAQEEKSQKESVADKTADELMRESMAYADKYIESANLVASNIRKDTLERAKEADARVAAMLEKASVFTKETEGFEETLSFFKTQLEGVIKEFSE